MLLKDMELDSWML